MNAITTGEKEQHNDHTSQKQNASGHRKDTLAPLRKQ
jgi:hypothetical protein